MRRVASYSVALRDIASCCLQLQWWTFNNTPIYPTIQQTNIQPSRPVPSHTHTHIHTHTHTQVSGSRCRSDCCLTKTTLLSKLGFITYRLATPAGNNHTTPSWSSILPIFIQNRHYSSVSHRPRHSLVLGVFVCVCVCMRVAKGTLANGTCDEVSVFPLLARTEASRQKCPQRRLFLAEAADWQASKTSSNVPGQRSDAGNHTNSR
ncbi:unnamed protein product [Protopolystoma xenopodis]|uniref:Uncharacterized protein n=1 Tax=Protopolystoma xenopodis TaxID=117903 RepID=A0A3S5AAU3_9PLAT|nr:unnamed protein product [Protopolystoma xenopodis]